MTHFQKKNQIKHDSPIEISDGLELKDVINEHFPDLTKLLGLEDGLDLLIVVNKIESFCGYHKRAHINLPIQPHLNELINYMVDNKHLYEWWKL